MKGYINKSWCGAHNKAVLNEVREVKCVWFALNQKKIRPTQPRFAYRPASRDLRFFRQFSGLKAGSVKVAFSRPAWFSSLSRHTSPR